MTNEPSIDPPNEPPLERFIVVWLGQMGSTIGSRMTAFAMVLWAWDLTEQATAIALIGFFSQVPRMAMTPFAGVIVDCWNRKRLMMVGDTVAGVSTVVILGLHTTGHLALWHLYGAGAINAAFGQIQQLAYTTSMTLMVPQRHYSRGVSLNFLSGYGAGIFAPALAGSLYTIIGLSGILVIDLATFAIAISTVIAIAIPQPTATPQSLNFTRLVKDISEGFRYIGARPGMLGILVVAALFQFAHEISNAVHSPMILARTQNSARALALVSATSGIGGVIGALLITLWGGPHRRIHGVLLGMSGAGLSKIGFSLGQGPGMWMPMQFFSSLNFPLLGSSGNAIWLSKVSPELQGRVFSASLLIKGAASPLGRLVAGPLADRVFEPAMAPTGMLAPVLGGVFGVGAGAGMAILYLLSGSAMLLIGLGGYLYRPLRIVEDVLPDHQTQTCLKGE
ncbi:MAG: MFS transporter [Cyanobacteria bacterium J06659_2]